MNAEENMPPALETPFSAGEILHQSVFQALRRLKVEETASEIIVSGSVSSYYLKQLAQECLIPYLGARRLRNCIDVELPKGRAGNTG